MEVTWQTISLFVALFGALSAAQLKAIDWMIRRGFEAYAPQFASLEKRLSRLETETAEIRRDYVRRDEWQQQISELGVKIELLSVRLDAAIALRRTEGRDA